MCGGGVVMRWMAVGGGGGGGGRGRGEEEGRGNWVRKVKKNILISETRGGVISA